MNEPTDLRASWLRMINGRRLLLSLTHDNTLTVEFSANNAVIGSKPVSADLFDSVLEVPYRIGKPIYKIGSKSVGSITLELVPTRMIFYILYLTDTRSS